MPFPLVFEERVRLRPRFHPNSSLNLCCSLAVCSRYSQREDYLSFTMNSNLNLTGRLRRGEAPAVEPWLGSAQTWLDRGLASQPDQHWVQSNKTSKSKQIPNYSQLLIFEFEEFFEQSMKLLFLFWTSCRIQALKIYVFLATISHSAVWSQWRVAKWEAINHFCVGVRHRAPRCSKTYKSWTSSLVILKERKLTQQFNTRDLCLTKCQWISY